VFAFLKCLLTAKVFAFPDMFLTPKVFAFPEMSLTPKVFANFSPGFALKPWDKTAPIFNRNPERVASASHHAHWRIGRIPRLPMPNPGLKLANTSLLSHMGAHEGTTLVCV